MAARARAKTQRWPPPKAAFQALLTNQRLAKGLRQRDLADALEYETSSYSEIERRRGNPPGPAIGVISKTLELPLEDIFAAAGWSYFPTARSGEEVEAIWRRLAPQDRDIVLAVMRRLLTNGEARATIDEAAV